MVNYVSRGSFEFDDKAHQNVAFDTSDEDDKKLILESGLSIAADLVSRDLQKARSARALFARCYFSGEPLPGESSR